MSKMPTKEELKKKLDDLISKHYNRQTKKWLNVDYLYCLCSDEDLKDEFTDGLAVTTEDIRSLREMHCGSLNAKDDRPVICKNFEEFKKECNEEETRTFQSQVRDIRFSIQMLDEEIVVIAGNSEQANKLMPLVSRRKHPELWEKLGKILQDGNIFTFKPEISINVCGCTDEQLEAELLNVVTAVKKIFDRPDETEIIIFHEKIRQLHTASFNEEDSQFYCANPKKVIEVHQNKHTIGNWNCKSCLNLGTEINSVNDANSAMSSVKALEWCPRFLPLLRNIPITGYMKAFGQNKICYAGLLHSEMSFEELEVEVPSSSPEELAVEPTTLVKKTYVVITKKCDTCGYTDVIKKEYNAPAPVEGGQLLGLLPEV